MKMFRFNFYYTRKENFFNNNNAEQTNGLIGYLRGDFGKNGNEFYTSWLDKNEKLNKEPFTTEFDNVTIGNFGGTYTGRALCSYGGYGTPIS